MMRLIPDHATKISFTLGRAKGWIDYYRRECHLALKQSSKQNWSFENGLQEVER